MNVPVAPVAVAAISGGKGAGSASAKGGEGTEQKQYPPQLDYQEWFQRIVLLFIGEAGGEAAAAGKPKARAKPAGGGGPFACCASPQTS